jgi:hypothetical protein
MAAAPDIELQMYQKIWDLLEANAEWETLFDEANRIRYDTLEGTQQADKSQTSDGDYPQARLWLETGAAGLFTDEVTFETHSPGGPNKWIEKSVHVFMLELKSQLMKFGQVTSMGAESRAAIRAGGPRLGGLSYVTDVALSWSMKEIDKNATDQTLRWEHRLRIQVRTEYEGSAHTGE